MGELILIQKQCCVRVVLGLSLWLASAVLSAAELTWSVDGTFADGGTFSGTFQQNPGEPAERRPSDWDLGVAGGSVGTFPPRSFSPANSGVYMLNWPPNTELTYHFIDPDDGNKRQLRITPASPLDGSLAIVPLALLAGNGRVECFNCAPYRNIVAGSFVIESVRPTLILESIAPDPTTEGATTTATISIDEIAAYGPPTGPVTVFDGLNTLCVITLPDTSCTFAAPATPGGQTAHAQYPGDANYTSAISNTLPFTIEPAETTTVTLVSIAPEPTLVGQTTTATVEVEEVDGFGPPTGTVTVIDSYNQEFCTITLPDTQCSFEPIYQSTATVVAYYSGDANYASGTSNSLPIRVGPAVSDADLVSLTPNPAAVGDTVMATISVELSDVFPPPTGEVIIHNRLLDTLCTVTLPDTSCTFGPVDSGNMLVTALYSGDANYEPDNSIEQLLVVVGITGAPPPNGIVGLPYSYTYLIDDFDPDGPAVSWAVTAGALPPGLTLAPGGLLSGIPTTIGTYTGTVTATVGSLSPSQEFSITIFELPPNASGDAGYSNLATFRNQSFAAGGATQQIFNTITRMAADDLNLAGSPPYSVNGFRFTVTNLNSVNVSASPLVRFYHADGPGGGPGTLIEAFNYNPITFTAGVVGTIKTSTQFVLPTSEIWAGIVFDNNGGATGATAAQLDNLGQGVFSPAEVGFSDDQYFVTTDAGTFTSDFPAGTITDFGGAPPADFGWEILTAQEVDLSITKTDGVDTATPGGSVVYTITASNAGPDTVFNARVVDEFPDTLTCTWTCEGSAGNTCAASGSGDINDRTVALLVDGSVTYTATCDVSLDATGTLVNTAIFFAPDTAVEANVLDNTATDTDTIGPAFTVPGAPVIGTATPGDGEATIAFTAPVDDGGSTITSYTATCDAISASGTVPSILVTGLTNGTEYSCTVTATNEAGEGPPSDAVLVTPFGLPGAPVIGTATPGDSEATIAFTAPLDDGGSTITSYTATCDGISAGGTVPSILVTGLTNGTEYSCSVTATNEAGEGPPSDSVLVTPFGLPGAPVIGTATPGDTEATIEFTAPADDGGSTITGYTATCDGISAGGTVPSILVTGLTNGTEYSCSVTATNEAGEGPPSDSVLVTPFGLPGAPVIGTATQGDGEATIAFTAPLSDGGSAITSYTASCDGISADGTVPSILVTGLTNGTEYTCSVTATNEAGEGPASDPVLVTPFGLPGAPVIGTATPGDGEATIAFTAPADDGGSAITGYTASCDGITADGTVSSILVTGLTNGTEYSCSVTATNEAGEGPPSDTVSVTPFGLPGAPVIGTATPGDSEATIAFTAPLSDGGSAITGYTASCDGISANGTVPSILVTGLTNGTEYSCSVTATNEAGEGPPSDTVSVTPFGLPGAPVIGVATPGDGEATIAFTAPADDGGSTITSYTATCDAISADGTVPAILVTGLTNGTEYTCSVTATNEAGEGPASEPVLVTPFGLPGAPVIGVATPGDSEATIAFTAPLDDGGSAIISYTASCDGISADGTVPSILVTGLTNGTEYTCSVTATNEAGEGPASDPVLVTPFGLPGAPVIGIATPGDGEATIAFTAPVDDGGSTITGYTATCDGISADGAVPSILVTGLTNGTEYSCMVTATNEAGEGPASDTVLVTPFGLPGAPVIGTATPGDGEATIAFTAPLSDGGSAITSYTASCDGISSDGTVPSILVTGLTNGTEYSCSVTATNEAGEGPPSDTVLVTPIKTTFTGPSATGSGTITASFEGGGLGCTYSAAEFIGAPPGEPPVPPTAPDGPTFPHGLFNFSTTGCDVGSTLSFTITYPVALPPDTQYWKYGPTPDSVTPDWYTLAATIAGNTVTFTITDGGLGDDDVAANGTIVDQGGPGIPPIPGNPSFTVTKQFDDLNTAEVEVQLSCNTGLPLVQSQEISPEYVNAPGNQVKFILTSLADSAADCTVSETPVPGYQPEYVDLSGAGEVDEEGCHYTDVVAGDSVACRVINHVQPVPVTIEKIWIGVTNDEVFASEITLQCTNVVDGSQTSWTWDSFSSNGSDLFVASVKPKWDGSTSCTVTELNPSSAVEVAGCESPISVAIAQTEAGCTMTNTVFFEGIPTLNRYGVVLLALLMLGVGFVGFRRLT